MTTPAAARPSGPPPQLPALRDEVCLHPGPRSPDGAPSWTLEDPSAGRWFRIGWLEFEALVRWHLGTPEAIAEAIANETALKPTPEQIEALARFLYTANLVVVRGERSIGRLGQQVAAMRANPLSWLVKNYLFVRIPLVRPDRFLDRTYPLIQWVFGSWFRLATILAAITGVILIIRRWDSFLATFLHFFTWEGALLLGSTLLGAKLIHELGHAYTAKRFGCAVPTMGVAFMVLWPVLYTDTSSAWRLTDRRQRLAIGAAGINAELAIAAWATLAWTMLPDGPWRSAAFLLASSTWILTLLINLNPFMRFDGYYLLSDWLDVANLQERAFGLGRWRLREWLFGFGDPPPEPLSPRLARTMLIYAYGTWIYRFFLFLGIALIVYHLFFKLLGLFLFAVEIWWFILRPIVRELGNWLHRRKQVRLNRAFLTTLTGFAALLGLLLVPWQGTVHLPGVLRAEHQAILFLETPARLVEIGVERGDRVRAGALLFRFEQPDIAFELAQAERRAAVAAWQVEFQSLSEDLAGRSRVIWQELETARAEAAALRADLARLVIRAPFDGVVVERADPLAIGEWLPQDTELAVVIDRSASLVEAYLPERDLHRLAIGAEGRFYPADLDRQPVPVRVTAVDGASSRALGEPMLASTYGGRIAVREGEDGTLIPETPVYRVLLSGQPPLPDQARMESGEVRLEAGRASIAHRLWQDVVAVAIRESGF